MRGGDRMTLDDALYHTKCVCSLADANEYPSALVHVEALKMVIIELEKRMKRGKWIAKSIGSITRESVITPVYEFTCNQCGYTASDSSPFCPWCRADMREEDTE